MEIFKGISRGDVVSFSLYEGVQTRLGNDYNNCKIVGLLDAASTTAFNNDPQQKHALVYSAIPAGMCPNDPNKYDWINVRLVSGENICIGVPWIIPESVRKIEGNTITFTVANCTQEDIVKIREQIAAIGKSVSSINLA